MLLPPPPPSQADKLAEEERERRIEESKGEYDSEKKKTYDKLVNVQEDLLKHIRKMKVGVAHTVKPLLSGVLLSGHLPQLGS